MTDLEERLLKILENDIGHLTTEVSRLKQWVWIGVGLLAGSGALEISKIVGA